MPENTSILDLLKRYETSKIVFDNFMLFAQEEISKDREKRAFLEEIKTQIALCQNKIAKEDVERFISAVKMLKGDAWFAMYFIRDLYRKTSVRTQRAACSKAGKKSGEKRCQKREDVWKELEIPLMEAYQELRKYNNQKGGFQKTIDTMGEKHGALIKSVMEKYSRRTDIKSFFKYHVNCLITCLENSKNEEYKLNRKKRKPRQKK